MKKYKVLITVIASIVIVGVVLLLIAYLTPRKNLRSTELNQFTQCQADCLNKWGEEYPDGENFKLCYEPCAEAYQNRNKK